MHRMSGLLLMLSGMLIGAFLYLPAPPNGEDTLAEVTRISAAPDRATRVALAPTEFENAVSDKIAARDASGQSTAKAPAPWRTVLTSSPSPLKSYKPDDAMTRYELTRDLQRELKRAGCYGGEITGAWSPSTQRAMAAFMDRINASLPMDEPDYILLTLMQSNATTSCGGDCASKEVRDAAGRCVPRAVLAQAERRSAREEARRIASARSAEQHDRIVALQQRKSQHAFEVETRGGMKRIRVLPAPADVAQSSVKPDRIAAATELPWQRTAPVARPRPQPMPGLMSVGSPLGEGAAPSASGQTSERLVPPAPRAAAEPLPWQAATLDGDDDATTARSGLAVIEAPDSAGARLPDAVAKPEAVNKAGKASEKKRYSSNGYGKKSRRGEPRPGTMRYNLMQSLGGIY